MGKFELTKQVLIILADPLGMLFERENCNINLCRHKSPSINQGLLELSG